MRWSGFFLTKILPMRRHISIHMMFQHGRRRDGGVRGSVRKTNAANNPPNRNPQPCQPSSTVDSAFTCKFGYIPDTKRPAPPISRAHIENCSSAHTEYASALDPHPKHDPHLSESVCRSWRFRRMPLHLGGARAEAARAPGATERTLATERTVSGEMVLGKGTAGAARAAAAVVAAAAAAVVTAAAAA